MPCLRTPRHRLVQDAGLAIVRGIAVPPEGRWGTLAKPALGVGSPVPCGPAPDLVVSRAWGSAGPRRAALVLSSPASLQVN